MSGILDAKWALFLQVADAGSVSAAALALDMQQSMVSRHIARLEEEAGARLFRRTGRGVVLTELGQQIYPRLKALTQDAEQLFDDIRTSGGTAMGDVRVGLLPSTVPMLAGTLFRAVRTAWPRVRLHLSEGSSTQLEEWLQQGRLDLALLLREEETAAPDEVVLVKLPLYLVVPVRHPLARRTTIAFEDLAELPLVLPSEPHPLRARLAKLARQKGIVLTQALEADSIRLQHEIVASDGGFAITAGTLTAPESCRLATVHIVRPSLSRAIVLGVTRHRAHTRATWEVTRMLSDLASAMLRKPSQN